MWMCLSAFCYQKMGFCCFCELHIKLQLIPGGKTNKQQRQNPTKLCFSVAWIKRDAQIDCLQNIPACATSITVACMLQPHRHQRGMESENTVWRCLFAVFLGVTILGFWFTHYRVMYSPLLIQNRSRNSLCSNKHLLQLKFLLT